jgi:hypothetical protein
MPMKHRVEQAAMKTHLSQPIGGGAFDGQHGMSPAISSIISEADMSSAMATIDMAEDVISAEVAAITGRETGAKARPAVTRIASNQRMTRQRFTGPGSRNLVATARRQPSYHEIRSAGVDRNQGFKPALSSG